jgi:hypothetical protein
MFIDYKWIEIDLNSTHNILELVYTFEKEYIGMIKFIYSHLIKSELKMIWCNWISISWKGIYKHGLNSFIIMDCKWIEIDLNNWKQFFFVFNPVVLEEKGSK